MPISLRSGATREPCAAHAMTVPARPAAFEDDLASSRVADRYHGGAGISHGADVGHDAGQFGVLELVRRHGGTRHSGGDQAGQVFVGDRLAELAAAQIDIRDRSRRWRHGRARNWRRRCASPARFRPGCIGRRAPVRQSVRPPRSRTAVRPEEAVEDMRRNMSTDSTENLRGKRRAGERTKQYREGRGCKALPVSRTCLRGRQFYKPRGGLPDAA